MDVLRRRIVATVESVIGRHESVAIYGAAAGDPGLCGPGSVSWKLHGDVGVFAGAGLSAIVMELLHPLVMAGVDQHSDYREHPERRARSTFGYVVQTTFGSTEAAEKLIGRVRSIHERIDGVAPGGRPYRAADPDLLGWVHTSIPLAMMRSWERYKGPLTVAAKNRYLAEQAVIARLGGAGEVPETVDELDDYLEAIRPQLELTDALRDFLTWATIGQGPPGLAVIDGLNRRMAMRAAMSLMPSWAGKLTGLEQPPALKPAIQAASALNVQLVSWAFGVPAYRRLAEARTTGARAPVAV